MEVPEDIWIYLLKFTSTRTTGRLGVLNIKWNDFSKRELEKRESKRLIIKELHLTSLPNVFPESHLLKGKVIDYSIIEYLDCHKNNLTSIDVELPSCKRLYCYYNNLTSFDTSKLQLFSCEILNCSRNQLSSLDTSGLSSCKLFYCSNNILTSLDTSSLKNCEKIACDGNPLTSFDTSGLTSSCKWVYYPLGLDKPVVPYSCKVFAL